MFSEDRTTDLDQTHKITIKVCGDQAIAITFKNEISLEVHRQVTALSNLMNQDRMNSLISGVTAIIPTYCTVMIQYQPLVIAYQDLIQWCEACYSKLQTLPPANRATVKIPVCYGGSYGPDLHTVAELHGLQESEVIRIHSSALYPVYMLGFTPGFPYLGGMSKDIATPRLEKPRLKIDAGSVGIAGEQTGIYPLDSPGGWQIIGRTPLRLFDMDQEPPFLLKSGDSIQFVPIDEQEFQRVEASYKSSAASFKSTASSFKSTASSFKSTAASSQMNCESSPNKCLDDVNRLLSSTEKLNSPKENSVIIEKQGMMMTIQDFGRLDYQSYGVPTSGVMDEYSATIANLLVGNSPKEAVFEMTFQGCEMRFMTDSIIAVTGAKTVVTINQQEVSMWESIHVRANDCLSIGAASDGLRIYLAILGGIDVPFVMGSRSTYTKAGFGGWHGRVLKKGDQIPLIGVEALHEVFHQRIQYPLKVDGASEILFKGFEDIQVIRVILGPQEDAFTETGIQTFLSSVYKLSNECDRMGYRLEGAAIEHVQVGDILSDGITFGAIQVPGHGMPIVMMADHQTTGGYTKIANVISVDLSKLAQMRPGQSVRFERVSLEFAHEALLQRETFFHKIRHNCLGQVENPCREKTYQVKVNGVSYQVTVQEIL